MRKTLLLCIFLIVVLSENALAAAFTTSASPTVFNASSTQLINFTINNIDSIAVKEVNITLPADFTYFGDAGTSQSGASFILLGNILRWYNFQLSANSTEYFWFKATAPQAFGSYNFNVSILDNNNVVNSSLVAITVQDKLAPTWSNLVSSPLGYVIYAPKANYSFNVTWLDNIAVSAVRIEHNFTGTIQNYTVSKEGNVYYYAYNDLGAGSYKWRFYATDTSGNSNSTPQSNLVVNKAVNTIDMAINGKLNQNANVNNNEQVFIEIKVAGSGTIYLFKNNSLVASNPGTSLNYSVSSLAAGSHTFKATVTSVTNANYSDNSTGISYTVTSFWPAPRWATRANVTLMYSPDYNSTFFVDWTDANDPSGFNVSIIETNMTGSAKNHTMYRLPGKNTAYFNITLPAGTFYWKAYGNNSFGMFNSTPKNNFSVLKAVPPITLSINPDLFVQPGSQATVSCGTPTGLVVSLYRNGVVVSNPSITTFYSEESHAYACNVTFGNQNYTTGSEIKLLTVTKDVAQILRLDLLAGEKLIYVVQDYSNSTTFKVVNRGNFSQAIKPSVVGINESYYSVTPLSAILKPRENVSFKVIFAGGGAAVGEMEGSFVVQIANATLTQDFVLKILPSNKTINSLKDDILLLKSEVDSLAEEIAKLQAKGRDTGNIELLYERFKSNLNQSESYLNQGDHYNAAILANELKGTLNQLKSLLKIPIGKELEEAIRSPIEKGELYNIGIILIIVSVSAILAFAVLTKKFKLPWLKEKSRVWEELKKKWKELVESAKEQSEES